MLPALSGASKTLHDFVFQEQTYSVAHYHIHNLGIWITRKDFSYDTSLSYAIVLLLAPCKNCIRRSSLKIAWGIQ